MQDILAKKIFKKNIFHDKKAFTLAEIIIVLGIIGIIAELTIPSLLMNTQEQGFKSKMKKEYSILSQVQLLITSEEGTNFADALSTCSDLDHNCFRDVLKTKLLYNKECDSSNNLGNCFPALENIKYLNGNSANTNFLEPTTSGLMLNDGASFTIYLDSSVCTGANDGSKLRCGWITVDVNGLKAPNIWGKDIYLFLIYDNQVLPGSVGIIAPQYVSADDGNAGSNKGFTCASKYISSN